MVCNTPRILIAGTGSGCGKTTVVCSVLKALFDAGERVVSFKCGPDYIDPMFHKKAIGIPSRNLDLFLNEENAVRFLFAKSAAQSSLAVIEGVMGLYDGMSASSTDASSYDLARATKTPVVLVMGCRGMSASAAAVVKGFAALRKDANLRAVILNQVSPALYPRLKDLIEQETGVPVAGFLPPMPEAAIKSRHLGLITADEMLDLKEKLGLLSRQARETVDLALLKRIAIEAREFSFEPVQARALAGEATVAVAMDEAFCFYYEDNLDLLESLGARIVPFSPLRDESLPEGADGLILGGGYPELYAKALSKNKGMRAAIGEAAAKKMPLYAECGGFLYLNDSLEGMDGISYPMTGVLRSDAFRTQKLVRFGYETLRANENSMLFQKGETIRAHEFHYWDATGCGDGFSASKPGKDGSWGCVHATDSLFAGFPHLHFYSKPKLAERFLGACISFGKKRGGKR